MSNSNTNNITLSKKVYRIVLTKDEKVHNLTTTKNTIVLSKVGIQGASGKDGVDGVGVPTGGTTGQILAKIDGTDYNTEWVDGANTLSWIDVAGDVEYTGVETAIASGDVLEADFKGDTIYRFINSTNNANGYPIEDSFYSDFDGTTLTNLIVIRG